MENKCTLVVVDFQYDFCTGGSLPVPGSDMALARISNLISSGQVDNVIFTADWHPANHCSFKRNGGQWVDHCLQFTDGAAIADPLVRSCVRLGIPYQVITDKRGYYLAQTATDSCRIPKRPMNIVVCGLAGDYCVIETLKNLKPLLPSVYIEGTGGNLFKIINNPLRGFIIADGELEIAHIKPEKDFTKECVADIDFELTSEEQKSYFY